MDYATLIEFIKKNSGAAVAIVLLYINSGKLEYRLERVETALFECYDSKLDARGKPIVNLNQPQFAILPEKIKIKRYV